METSNRPNGGIIPNTAEQPLIGDIGGCDFVIPNDKRTRAVNLRLSPFPGESRIEVEGHELRGVTGVHVNATAQGMPTLELELGVYEVSTVEGEMQTFIPDATRETLIALGWTPPEDSNG